MKLLAATTLLIASLGAGTVEAGTITGAGAGAAISVHWNDRDDHRRGGYGHHRNQRGHGHHRGHRGYRGHHYANPALWQRYGRRHARAVNGYAELSKRRPCEWVRVEHLDAYDDPMSVEYKRCFTASGYAFEVPGSRVVIR